jgi:hypothetical protein
VVEMPRKPAQAEKQNDNEQHLDHLKDKKMKKKIHFERFLKTLSP